MTRTPGTETAIVPGTLPADAPVVIPAAAAPAPATQIADPADTDAATVPRPAPPRQGQSRLPYSFERSLQPVPHGMPAITHERISFTAPCPACGTDAEWVEVREDTRVRAAVHCSCA